MSQEDKDTTGPDATTAEAKDTDAPSKKETGEEKDAASGESAGSEGATGEGDAGGATAEPTPEERLEASEKEKKALRERMLRVAADFENFRKRSTREVGDARKRSRQDTIKDLLPVFDNLERATAHADQAPDVATLSEGLRMVLKQFIDTLGKMEVERIDAEGQPFDPSLHESIQYEHSDEHAAGLVIKALQPGYRMGGQLLRPALVVVSRGPASPEEGADEAKVDAAEGGDHGASADGAEAD